MPYAEGRIFNDADSHFMETKDWIFQYAILRCGPNWRRWTSRLAAGEQPQNWCPPSPR
jgi:hypothetical protein